MRSTCWAKPATRCGGSHLHLVLPNLPAETVKGSVVPRQPDYAPALYRALHQAMRERLVLACHDLSEGGLAVAAAEMSIAGRFGLALTIELKDPTVALFSESNGRLLAEVDTSDCEEFESYFRDGLTPYVRRIGLTTPGRWLSISTPDRKLINLPVDVLLEAWLGPVIP